MKYQLDTWVMALLAAGAGAAAIGQEPPSTTAPAFGGSIEVRVIDVEAVVTGPDGKLVRGLTRDDFRLLVDGRQVTIDYFTAVASGAAATTQHGGVASETGSAAADAGAEPVGHSYLLLLDDSLSLDRRRDLVLSQLQRELTLLRPADHMAVVTFDGLHLDVLAPWTNDIPALTAAIARARGRRATGTRSLVHYRAPESDAALIRGLAGTLDGDDVASELQLLEARGLAPDAVSDAHKAADAAAAALRAFEAPPGRKVALLVSGAWAIGGAPERFAAVRRAADTAGYTLYPVDAASSPSDAILATDALARQTGGRALTFSSGDVLADVIADTDTYYSLGFTPAGQGDDRPHAVTVEVRRPGLQVHARTAVVDPSPAGSSLARTEGILLFRPTPADERLLVRLGRPGARGHELVVPVVLGVPVEALAIEKRQGHYTASIAVSAAIIDRNGGRADLPLFHLFLDAPGPPRSGSYARFDASLVLSKTRQRLVFTVADPLSGRPLWGEVTFDPAADSSR